jgi:hypothetical protein
MQTATVNPPIRYNQSALQIPRDEGKVRLEAPRYVFVLGDFIEPADKRQLRDIGGWTGGLKIGSSPNEGAPTMWRTNYIINRGVFVPLETAATTANEDMKPKDMPSVKTVGQDAAGNPINVREVLPGNDILLLQGDSFRQQGVVEITQLQDKPFNQAQELNRFFFPELDRWLEGSTAFPELLSDYVDIIRGARVESDAQAITQAEMIEAAQKFETYARAQIEANRQAVLQGRTTNMGGFSFKWSERTRMFAKQLGITLEDDNIYTNTTIAANGQIEDPTIKARELELKEESNRIEREKLELLKLQYESTKPKKKEGVKEAV